MLDLVDADTDEQLFRSVHAKVFEHHRLLHRERNGKVLEFVMQQTCNTSMRYGTCSMSCC